MKPSRAQRLAAFEAAKAKIKEFEESMIGEWAEIEFTDDEIHQISDAAVDAAFGVNPVEECQ